ncbi:phosphoribosylanthranilate isomerase TRP1 [Sugiyamaella lignohabitans]|uniref:N-(5'-phosphoribosyl)anthranilate isomerase n=1 Tax=Sugiyamaella lignohabitans TaxID=796027 RepID=A0A167ET59_9ASCO|nr:phosphoribosylanthranilate isomerase TRP1 [Sugiyamaella lignohabitans]ANB14425.1 phosphoribosylanthranilate isomerase TRP1 [Sugiyamaella lignohabitans]
MADIAIFNDKARCPVDEQRRIFSQSRNCTPSSPFIVGHLNHSHTEPDDFIQFSQIGASVLVNCSGITLHNLAARNAINRLAVRPLLLWASESDKTQEYIVGEEVEAAVTGSDGILYHSSDLFRNDNPETIDFAVSKFQQCKAQALSSIVTIENHNHLTAFLSLPIKPTAVFTFDDKELAASVSSALQGSVAHVHLQTITDQNPYNPSNNNFSAIFIEDVQNIPKMDAHLVQVPTHSSSKSAKSTISTSITPSSSDNSPLVKVCGIKTVEAAIKALESGADMIGMILVPGRSRTVDFQDAKKISDAVHNYGRAPAILPSPSPVSQTSQPSRRLSVISSTTSLFQKATHLSNKDTSSLPNSLNSSSSTSISQHPGSPISRRGSTQTLLPPWPSLTNIPSGASVFEVNSRIVRAKTKRRPAIVGVFQNQPLETILSLQHELDLDYVQLHGDEPLEWCRIIPVPVIKRFTPNTDGFANSSLVGYHYISLLDGEIGGEGKLVDWSSAKSQVALGARFILAGGLNESNVASALQTEGVFGVDVSGGVETAGTKDLNKIERFVKTAKAVNL